MPVSWIFRQQELLIWVLALIWLYLVPLPVPQQEGWCAFGWLGLDLWPGAGTCAGCGIGRSINAVMHGQWRLSWEYHALGMPALAVILGRIVTLIGKYKTTKQHSWKIT